MYTDILTRLHESTKEQGVVRAQPPRTACSYATRDYPSHILAADKRLIPNWSVSELGQGGRPMLGFNTPHERKDTTLLGHKY